MIDFNMIAQEAIAQGNIPCVLEYDADRGVLYVHSAIDGHTALRICSLPKPGSLPIDITLDPAVIGYGVHPYDMEPTREMKEAGVDTWGNAICVWCGTSEPLGDDDQEQVQEQADGLCYHQGCYDSYKEEQSHGRVR
jgi:hypothetical protein